MNAQTIAHSITARTQGRYLLRRAAEAGPAPLLIGFHGYGENAEMHMEKLEQIEGTRRWHLCAVQGLHLFYNRRSGEVVASWMTRLNREQAIADNLAYVESVIDHLRLECPEAGPAVLAGFSQGVAMACRTAAWSGRRCSALILLGGDIPPDVKQDPRAVLPPVLLARGHRDDFYSEEKMRLDLEFLAARGVEAKTALCHSGHEWSSDFSRAAAAYLERLRASELLKSAGGQGS